MSELPAPESDRIQEVTVEELRAKVGTGMEILDEEEHMLLSMGPQHPSTHGVLRLLLELDGETVVNVAPDIGFLHTGIEKTMESKTYTKALVMTDRMDYLAPLSNNLGYILAVEKLLGVEATPRAQAIRVILTELTRIASHLVWLGTSCLDLAAMTVFLYCFREREFIFDIFEMCAGQRMMTSYFRPGGLWRDVPEDFEPAVRQFLDFFPGRIADYEALLKENPIFQRRTKGVGFVSAEDAVAWGLTGPSLRASIGTFARHSLIQATNSMILMCLRTRLATFTRDIAAVWRSSGKACALSSRPSIICRTGLSTSMIARSCRRRALNWGAAWRR
jgi:NADH-quinone oxidoreductase subunit D